MLFFPSFWEVETPPIIRAAVASGNRVPKRQDGRNRPFATVVMKKKE
tara:strand:+ start:27825 stop:27965 length:141 start_codon:yes stop_codon:yes gene_type:complete